MCTFDVVVIGAGIEGAAFASRAAERGRAIAILEQAFSVAPGLRSHTILDRPAGFRRASMDGQPLAGRVGERVSALTRLGSWSLTLGLLLGRMLADGLIGSDEPGGLDV